MKTLAEKALLVRLERSMWHPYAYDKRATSEIEQTHAVSNIGRFNKRLCRHSRELEAVQSAYNKVYSFLIKNTLPWLDDGLRILPADNYLEFSQTLNTLIQAADAAVDDLILSWDQAIEQDSLRMGALFNPTDYPTAEEMRGKWAIHVHFLPVPTSADFRVSISEEDKRALDARIAQAEKDATRHIIGELLEPIGHAVKRLTEYSGAKNEKLHKSIITNILDAAERMAKLNITGDPAIAHAIQDIIDTVKPLEIDALREDDRARAEVRAKLDALAKRFGEM